MKAQENPIIVLVRKGLLWEEIAATLSGYEIVYFDNLPPSIDELLEEASRLFVSRFICMNPRYYDQDKVDRRIVCYDTADAFVVNELHGNWGLFADYNRKDSNAYFACKSLGLLPFEKRQDALKQCCYEKSEGENFFKQHVLRGRAFELKGKEVARIVAEHSVYVESKNYALASLGCACDINLTHEALRDKYSSAIITAVHYYRKNPTDNMKLLQKWSVRACEKDQCHVEEFMSSVCDQNSYGGSIGNFTGGEGWYQAGGTGHTSLEQYLDKL